MHTVRIPNCYSHYFCVTVLVVEEVLHLPICKELAAYERRYHSSEDVFHREKSGTLISFTLSLLPHTVISSQLSTKICMKSQTKVYPTYRMHLLWFHTQLGILSPVTENPVQRLQRVQKPSQNKDMHHKFHLTVFSTVFHIKATSKKLHKIHILLSVYKQTLLNFWKIIFHYFHFSNESSFFSASIKFLPFI